jgi:hypothetical protein
MALAKTRKIATGNNAKVKILHDAHWGEKGSWVLHYQWCRWEYTNGSEPQYGYRFMWYRPDGTKQAARGQARIPSAAALRHLIAIAKKEGWGNKKAR